MDDELLTVEQAAAAYDVSPLTLRRRAHFGEIEGAVKVRGRRGQEWRLPAASLDALGYERRVQAERSKDDLLVVVRRFTAMLAEAHRENARLNRELGGVTAEAARLRSELAAERRLRTSSLRREHVLDLVDAVDAVDRSTAG